MVKNYRYWKLEVYATPDLYYLYYHLRAMLINVKTLPKLPLNNKIYINRIDQKKIIDEIVALIPRWGDARHSYPASELNTDVTRESEKTYIAKYPKK